MDRTRTINIKIRNSNKNVIERNSLAIDANNKGGVLMESGEGGVSWESGEGLVREDSCNCNVAMKAFTVKESINKCRIRRCKKGEAGGIGGSDGGGEVAGMEGMSKDCEATRCERSDHNI